MGFWDRLFAALQAWLSSELTIGVIAAVIAAGIAAVVIAPARRAVVRTFQKVADVWAAESRLRRAINAVNGDGVWLTKPISQPKDYAMKMRGAIPIISVANLKGGVGKTTIAANLAAFYAIAKGERILLIDLDFQGSLSSMLVPRAQMVPMGTRCKAAEVVADSISPNHFLQMLTPVSRMATGYCVPAYYDLAGAENQALVRWLLRSEKRDIRFRDCERPSPRSATGRWRLRPYRSRCCGASRWSFTTPQLGPMHAHRRRQQKHQRDRRLLHQLWREQQSVLSNGGPRVALLRSERGCVLDQRE